MRNNKQRRDEVLSRYFPTFSPVASQNTGLSGGSCLISDGRQTLVLRQRHPGISSSFLRQYRVLQHLPATIAPKPRLWAGEWMAVEYVPGKTHSQLPDSGSLATLLHALHREACFGWRISLLPLLVSYWQQCDPARRTPGWLRWLKKLRQRGEPHPLRLAPLHMDVHPGNLVHTPQGLRLIDWEYAGDGDVALELAAVWMDDAARRALVAAYAREAALDAAQLWRHVQRWRPWVLLLMAGWYECRWQQTNDQQFITLANEIWRQLNEQGKER